MVRGSQGPPSCCCLNKHLVSSGSYHSRDRSVPTHSLLPRAVWFTSSLVRVCPGPLEFLPSPDLPVGLVRCPLSGAHFSKTAGWLWTPSCSSELSVAVTDSEILPGSKLRGSLFPRPLTELVCQASGWFRQHVLPWMGYCCLFIRVAQRQGLGHSGHQSGFFD